MNDKQFDRNILFFGKDGQERLRNTQVAIVGVGGLGSHVVQQLALLGVGGIVLIDPEDVDETNRNRYIGLKYHHPIPGTPKVTVGEQLIREVNPQVRAIPVYEPLVSPVAFQAIMEVDHVIGCVDNVGARLMLTELCSAYKKPYFDLASDILLADGQYGGRVCIAWNGKGCLVCYGEIDPSEATQHFLNPAQRKDRHAIYGIPTDALGEVGPSVVSINGVVASLGVTELMLVVSGIRNDPRQFLNYRADRGIVSLRSDAPIDNCYYCVSIRGQEGSADVQRYLPL